MNLVDENYHVSIKDLVSAIGWEYMRTSPLSLQDRGIEYANKQIGFQMINPTEKWFPGAVYVSLLIKFITLVD